MKDINVVEQEMYYTKCKKLEDEIRQTTEPSKRKELQEKYKELRSNVTMQTLTEHMRLKSRLNALKKKQEELKRSEDKIEQERLKNMIKKMQENIKESQEKLTK